MFRSKGPLGSWPETLATAAAVSTLIAYLYVSICQPIPLNQWIAGIACFTSDRVSAGGHYYESPDSLCGATFPYPPGSLFLLHWATRYTGLEPLNVAKLLVLILAVLYSALSIWATVRLGTNFAFAACAFALISYAMSLQAWFSGGMTLAGDVVVLICAMAIVLLAERIENGQAIVWASVLLGVAFAFKIQAVSLYAGVALFGFCRPQISVRKKFYLAGLMLVSLVAVAILIGLIPNCWKSCIDTMRRHPRSLYRALPVAWAAFGHLWPYAAIPLGLAVIHWRRISLRGAWHGIRTLPAPIALLICFLPPYALMQFASMMKAGGAAYNLDYVVFLGSPLVILAASLFDFDKRSAAMVFGALASMGFLGMIFHIGSGFSEGHKLIADSRTYLQRKYPKAVILYSADQYFLLGGSSMMPATDVQTVWHYLTAGNELPLVVESLQSQKYDLLIYPGLIGNSKPFEAFNDLVHEYYIPAEDEETPKYLAGSLFLRRDRTR
jgi:hypothetical protein